ncbi:MAG: hypothetical protein EON97_00510 [Chitinophagaceae bacterium]|nr:MAG: hypothetical protein EON97_00510 [Chitinophagaceae bacterium]
MKFIRQTLSVVIVAMAITSCVKVNVGDDLGGGPVDPGGDPNESKVLSGTIDGDLTLAKDTYTLQGYVYVNNGATLTIAPGTIIKSDISQKGALIVERGSKLIAEGTVTDPIVFTSGKPSGERAPGDWGALVILGKAPTNIGTGNADGLTVSDDTKYGGTDPADNSGSIKYLRLEYCGAGLTSMLNQRLSS